MIYKLQENLDEYRTLHGSFQIFELWYAILTNYPYEVNGRKYKGDIKSNIGGVKNEKYDKGRNIYLWCTKRIVSIHRIFSV